MTFRLSRRLRPLVATCLAALLLLAPAPRAVAADAGQVAQLVARTGVAETVAKLIDPSGLERALHQQPGMAERLPAEAVQASWRRHFDAAAITDALSARFARGLPDEAAAEILAWYDTPLGRRASAADRAFGALSEAETLEAMQKAAPALAADPARRALIEAEIDALGIVDMQLALVMAVMRAAIPLSQGANGGVGDPAEMSAIFDAMGEQLRPALRQATVLASGAVRAEFTNAELEQVIAAETSPAQQRMFGLFIAGLRDEIGARAGAVYEDLAQILSQRKL